MKRLAVLIALMASPAAAQVVTLKTGEHGNFTRIVLNLPKPEVWQLGRTEEGYEVAIGDGTSKFDLSDVYRLITTDRLRSIWVDPQSGLLQLGIGCTCHAIPFEFGPRSLVIDIREGAAPAESLFETPLKGEAALSALAEAAPSRPRTRPAGGETAPTGPAYDWIAGRMPQDPAPMAEGPTANAAALQTLDAEIDLGSFRALLTDQIGMGATEGVIEMRVPDTPPAPQESAKDPDQARVALSALPGLSIDDRDRAEGLTTKGMNCPAEEVLDLKSWAQSDQAAAELANAKGLLLAEFDTPQADRITEAARVHLYFGFGAEARNLLAAISRTYQIDPFLVAISYLVDNDTSPENPFEGLQSCNSNAALWALLATPETEPLDGLNGAAVARSAMELPSHIKSILAPSIVARLLQEGDRTNAEVVQNALARAVASDDPVIHLLEADVALTEHRPADAEHHLDELSEGEATLEGLFKRVEARFQQGQAIDQADVLAIEAFAFDQRSGDQEAAFRQALTHAYALTGAFAKAFGEAQDDPSLRQDVWETLAKTGNDSDVLQFAVGVQAEEREGLTDEVRVTLARRLLDLGLPNAGPALLADRSGPVELIAQINLANGDGRAALQAMSTTLDEFAPDLLASAYQTLGQYDTSAEILRNAGQDAEAARLDRWQGVWATEGAETDKLWVELASFAKGQGDTDLPPLAAAAADVERSAKTRDDIRALLQSVPMNP